MSIYLYSAAMHVISSQYTQALSARNGIAHLYLHGIPTRLYLQLGAEPRLDIYVRKLRQKSITIS